MTTPLRRRPVARIRVAAGGLGLLAMIAAVVAVGELLRHPAAPTSVPESELAGSDPRDELVCPEPLPREGQARDTTGESPRAVRVSSNDLYDCPQAFDGQRVVYRGEVVGALLARDGGVWSQLNDDVYAELLGPLPAHRDFRGGNAGVGVLLPPEVAGLVTAVGGPRTRGDVLEVRGTFRRVDPTGEVAVIRADDGALTTRGGSFDDALLRDRRIAALLAAVVAVATVIGERAVARRR